MWFWILAVLMNGGAHCDWTGHTFEEPITDPAEWRYTLLLTYCCMEGPGVEASCGCQSRGFDADGDGDVDLKDYAILTRIASQLEE